MRTRVERSASAEVRGHGHERPGAARGDRARSSRGHVVGVALALAVALVGCRDATKPAPTREDSDHTQLAKIVLADEAFDHALKAAEDASHAGDDAKGASILETDATRAADQAVLEGEHAQLETPWARARRDALMSVMQERRASIPSYAEAMRGDNLEAKLLVLTLQIDLQKRALEVATAALAPTPTGDAG